jgi:hypothetical protein
MRAEPTVLGGAVSAQENRHRDRAPPSDDEPGEQLSLSSRQHGPTAPARTAVATAARSARETVGYAPRAIGSRDPPTLANRGATAAARSTLNLSPYPASNLSPHTTGTWVTAGSASRTGGSASGRSCIVTGRGERRRGGRRKRRVVAGCAVAAEAAGNRGRGPGDSGVEPLESPPREMTRGAGEVGFFYLAARFSASKIISFL